MNTTRARHPSAVPPSPAPGPAPTMAVGAAPGLAVGPLDPQAGALMRTLWASGQAVALQAADFRLIDLNEAYAALLGRARADLLGCDPIDLQPADDQALNRAQRLQVTAAAAQGRAAPVMRHRFLGPQGQERWMAVLISNVAPAGAAPRWLSLVQDQSGEQMARQAERRAEDELAQWFELSSSGMLVYDDSGLIVRFNRALEALLGRVPQGLQQAPAELQDLLAWGPEGLDSVLVPGAPILETQVVLKTAASAGEQQGQGAPLNAGSGRARHLWARLACLAPSSHGAPLGGPARRVLAVVQDRSAEAERDLAQFEMGMLMDTASIGVATFDPGHGWLAPAASAPRKAAGAAAAPGGRPPSATGALLGIGRELVEAESLPEFERLQQALRRGERAEVRYAVRHPEMGRRWLLTRVEPAALSGGRNTTSIVTLDVTDRESAQRRNEQLLRELTTILDTSTAGIAYLRGPALVRCNRRFERMLGFEPGAAAGASLQEIFSRNSAPAEGLGVAGDSGTPGLADAAADALAQGQAFETEISHAEAGGERHWYSLSLRRAGDTGHEHEAVAVLTDITRLKLQQSELEQLLRDRELMFSLSEVGIVYQRGARIERANQAMAAITGWGSSELSTLDAAELYENARECVEFEARINQGLRDKGRFSSERRLKKRDGSLLWVQVAVRPVDGSNVAAGVISSFVDVDERRRARLSLASQAERTRSMLNSVLVGIVTVSERGIEWMNRSARRMFAGDLADFIGRPISVVATPEEVHPLRRADWLQSLQEGQAETFECRLRGRDGREFWVVGSAVLTSAGQGSEREVTFALLDIERRRQAEVSIAQAQASLQRVIETAPLAIALFDARSLRVQQLNQTAGEFFGRPLLALAGCTLQEMCEPAQAAALQQWLHAVGQGQGASEHEWREMPAQPPAGSAGATAVALETAGQPLRVWDCRIAPLDEDSGGVTQLLLVASDVTHQREAERARLQAAIDQREVLVREVHHRIKNNLQGVAGLLQQNAARRPELAGVLNEAVGQVQAIAQVHGLQVGGGKPLEVAALLGAIAQSVQRTFGRTVEVALVGRVPHLLPEAESIPVALTVNELLTNAIKHGPGERVLCTLIGRDEGVCIRISGQGTLAAGFDLKRVPAGVSGLGLVRALLPRRSATLTLTQRGAEVVAEVELRPPSVRWPDTEPRSEHDQRQLEL